VYFFLEVIDRWSNKILQILQRFPLASLASIILTIVSIMIIEVYGTNSAIIPTLNKIVLVATLAIFLFPALHLLSKKIWFKLVGVGLLVLYYYLLPLDVLNSVVLVRHGLLLLALAFMLFWAPFMDVSISNKNIWEWSQNMLLILLVAIILSLTTYLIFFVTMHSIEVLFGYTIETKRYIEFGVFVVGIFAVNYFLGQIPKYIMLLQVNRYERVGIVFTKYILTPIFFIYTLLLFSYVGKIILQKSWKVVNIDTMAVGYAIVAIATYMYWTPLWRENPNRKFRLFVWGSTLLVSLILGASIWLRVERGEMEPFYLMALFSAWLGVVSLYFLFFKEASYKWLFFSISLLIIFSQSEPLINLSVDLFDKLSSLN